MYHCCLTQRTGTIFFLELLCAWGDFVSDLSVALSIKFPTLSTFICMWTFIGVQVVPYLLLVTLVHHPYGWICPPPPFLCTWNIPWIKSLVTVTVEATTLFFDYTWGVFWCILKAGWHPNCDGFSRQSKIASRCGVVVWFLFFTPFLGCFTVFAFSLLWILVAVLVTLMVLAFILAWILLLLVVVLLRIVLFVFGFLLYVTKLLSFPDVVAVNLFFRLWSQDAVEETAREGQIEECEEEPDAEEMDQKEGGEGDDDGHDGMKTRQLEKKPIEEAATEEEPRKNSSMKSTEERQSLKQKQKQVSLFKLEIEGVRIFTLHFAYMGELVLESIAQLVIQIVVASMTHWSANTVFSVTVSSVLIVAYMARYAFWLLVLPVTRLCRRSNPEIPLRQVVPVVWRQCFIDMHRYYYTATQDDDDPAYAAVESEPPDSHRESLELPARVAQAESRASRSDPEDPLTDPLVSARGEGL